MKNFDFIEIKGAKEHNLKNVDINIPKNKLVVITGPSGSGKSSLAFDTLFAEGQRRYVDSLSSHAKYFLDIQNKPLVHSIKGLLPAIAIDQKITSKSPRSTVGTITEIYDHIRLLFSKIGVVFSPANNKPIKKYSIHQITHILMNFPNDTKLRLLSPVIKNQKGGFAPELEKYRQNGHEKAKINGKIVELANLHTLDPLQKHSISLIIDRIVVKEGIEKRIIESIEKAFSMSNGIVIIDVVELPNDKEECIIDDKNFTKGESYSFSNKYICENSDFILEELESKIFSFNSPFGACPDCKGLGTEVFFKEDLIIPNPDLSLAQGAIEPWKTNDTRYNNQLLYSLSKHFKFELNVPYKNLSQEVKDILLYGSKGEKISITTEEEFKKHTTEREFKGVINELYDKLELNQDDDLIVAECEKYQTLTNCHVCKGFRLKKESLQVKIESKNIGEVANMSIDDLLTWVQDLKSKVNTDDKAISDLLLQEIEERLNFLINVGVEYLSLNRSANTLSGGESQRIRLSTQISSGLSGVLYVLDEPSIGLHQSDNIKLINTLKNLRELGNSIVVIEHDEETMRAADWIIDVGPGAGKYGGEITAQGTLEDLMKNKNSITGLFLSGDLSIPVPKARRKYGRNEYIEIINARENNLKNLNVKIPLGMFIAVCGVSGGGKSTLIIDTLYHAVAKFLHGSKERYGQCDDIKGLENIDKIIKIDQSPIGRTPRSNPATYIGLFSIIRDLFTSLPQSRKRGYKSNRFSFNVKGGRCENCQGDGMIKVEMDFLPDVYIPCSVCNGKRYNKETLEVKYYGHSIADILNMDIRNALEVFHDNLPIKEKLQALYNVGLDYVKLGQSSTTLSGGEAQRIKLAKELSKKATGNTLYIFDEPTTGLHSCDIQRLLKVLHTLVDYGNTVLVIEHNLDVIKTADYILDIGPKGGSKGGLIVSKGTPEEVAQDPNSVTGKYLKELLK